MTVFNITDLHGSIRYLDQVRSELEVADTVVISGDITNFGGRSEVSGIIDAISSINPKILAVSGNCDRQSVELYLNERGINLHAESRTLGGILFVGLGGSLPGPGPTPNTHDEKGLGDFLKRIEGESDGRMLLVSHQPPYETATDKVTSGRHVGSRAVRDFIERRRPLVCLTGHIHESVGESDLAGCRVVNPGPFAAGRYAIIEIDDNGVLNIALRHVNP